MHAEQSHIVQMFVGPESKVYNYKLESSDLLCCGAMSIVYIFLVYLFILAVISLQVGLK